MSLATERYVAALLKSHGFKHGPNPSAPLEERAESRAQRWESAHHDLAREIETGERIRAFKREQRDADVLSVAVRPEVRNSDTSTLRAIDRPDRMREKIEGEMRDQEPGRLSTLFYLFRWFAPGNLHSREQREIALENDGEEGLCQLTGIVHNPSTLTQRLKGLFGAGMNSTRDLVWTYTGLSAVTGNFGGNKAEFYAKTVAAFVASYLSFADSMTAEQDSLSMGAIRRTYDSALARIRQLDVELAAKLYVARGRFTRSAQNRLQEAYALASARSIMVSGEPPAYNSLKFPLRFSKALLRPESTQTQLLGPAK